MIDVGGNRWAMALALLAALGLSGCPGDDGGGGAPTSSQGTTVSGTVTAPGGQLAKAEPGPLQWFASLFVTESHAQAPGLLPVAGQRILVFQIGNDGTPVTSASNPTGVIAQATTGANGSFSVVLPSGTALASNIIVQASTTGTPARVCDPSQANCPANQTQLNCPAVGTTLNINPAAELATRQILRRIAQAGATGSLNNYTNREVDAFVKSVQAAVAADPTLNTGNLNQVLTNIENRVQDLITNVLPGLENSGEVPPPPAATGNVTYNFVGFEAEAQSNGTLQRQVEFGTVVLNSNGTWTFAGQSQGAQLAESCSSSCSRTFTRTAVNNTDISNGTYVRTGNGRIIFTDSSDGSVIVAFTNPTETVVIVPFEEAGGFGVAVKQGSGLSTQTAQGTFNFKEFGSSLGSTQTTGSPWLGPLRSWNETGTATFTGTNMTANLNGSEMRQQVTCTPTATGCNLVAALEQELFNDNVQTPFSIDSTGVLTLTDADPGTPGNQTLTGEVSADGNFVLFPIPEPDASNIVIATKQAAGLSNASLNGGTYNIVVFGEILSTTGAITTFQQIGTVTFDSNTGNQTINVITTNVTRSESCPSNAACSFTADLTQGGTSTETRPYNVTANGTLTITSPTAGTINGFVSPDATFGVTTNSVDNIAVGSGVSISRRTIAVAVKRS